MTTESSVSAGEASWTEAEATQWRSMLGTGAALWAGGGRIEVEPGWWLAFSGARTVDYNVILCHGPDAKRDVTRSLEEVRAAKVPAVIMLGGQALGMANLLAEEGWVCVDTKPVMIMRPLIGEHDPAARRLRPEDLPEAHRLICSAFDTVPEFAEIALPSAAAENPTRVDVGAVRRRRDGDVHRWDQARRNAGDVVPGHTARAPAARLRTAAHIVDPRGEARCRRHDLLVLGFAAGHGRLPIAGSRGHRVPPSVVARPLGVPTRLTARH